MTTQAVPEPYELVQVSGSSPSWQIRRADDGAIVERYAGAASAAAARRLDELNHPRGGGETA